MTFGESLKAAREAKSLSLEDVASATRINKKYLQAIENGAKVDLPELYVQAFIKDYAAFVGILPESAPHQAQQELSIEQGRIASTVSSTVTTTNLPGSSAIKYPKPLKPKRSHQFVTLLLTTIVVLASFLALLFWTRRDTTTPSAQEVKFSDVVKQWETTVSDSHQSPFIAGGADTLLRLDTLILEGSAVETVWVRVVIDGSEIKEYSLPPLGRFKCEGRQYFELSMDNARGIIWSFNGDRIGLLSQIKKPLWNVTVTPATVEQLKKIASGKG